MGGIITSFVIDNINNIQIGSDSGFRYCNLAGLWLLKIIVGSSSIPKYVLSEICETVMLLKIKGGW